MVNGTRTSRWFLEGVHKQPNGDLVAVAVDLSGIQAAVGITIKGDGSGLLKPDGTALAGLSAPAVAAAAALIARHNHPQVDVDHTALLTGLVAVGILT